MLCCTYDEAKYISVTKDYILSWGEAIRSTYRTYNLTAPVTVVSGGNFAMHKYILAMFLEILHEVGKHSPHYGFDIDVDMAPVVEDFMFQFGWQMLPPSVVWCEHIWGNGFLYTTVYVHVHAVLCY